MATPGFIKAPMALSRALFLPHPKANPVDLTGKVIIVTGATPGSIGFESAKVFADWGAQVCVTVRSEQNISRCQEAFNELLSKQAASNINVQQMDLQNSESVSAFTAWFSNNYPQLDVLLNNAGIYLDMLGQWKQEQLSEDGFEVHWRVNYLGNLQVSCELLPLLRQSAAKTGEARVVMVSSHMHDNCSNEELFSGLQNYKSVKAYGRSKLALSHFSVYMHEQHQNNNIKFVCVHPGSIYTNLVNKGLEGNPTLLAVRDKLAWMEKAILLSPQQGAQTQIMCASDPHIKSGAYYYRCAPADFAPTLNDRSVSEKLWQESKAWLTTINPDTQLVIPDSESLPRE